MVNNFEESKPDFCTICRRNEAMIFDDVCEECDAAFCDVDDEDYDYPDYDYPEDIMSDLAFEIEM